MQTFLPYPNFRDSVATLDTSRLGNQRNECFVILEAIVKGTTIPKENKPVVNETGFCQIGMPKRNTGQIPWYNHTATRMWRNYRWALLCYSFTVIREWVARGNKDTTHAKFLKFGKELKQHELEQMQERQRQRHAYMPDVYPAIELLPWWLGNKRLHDSHKSNLLSKDIEHYSQFNWDVEPEMEYYWPV